MGVDAHLPRVLACDWAFLWPTVRARSGDQMNRNAATEHNVVVGRGRNHAALRLLVAALAVFVVVVGGLMPTSFDAAVAATTNSCLGSAADDQNSVRVTASHGKIFYIDSGQSQSLDAAYVSYKVQNLSGAAGMTNVWASLDTFTGGAVVLANPADAYQPLGDIAASTSNTAFFMLKATASSTRAQSHVVHVYSGKPGTAGATELYNCTFSFTKVSETIKAAANKVTSIATTSVTTIGSTMTITVQGNSGTVGAGNSIDGSMIWISPAARSTWPTGALRLESTLMSLYSNNSRNGASFLSSYTNQLRIPVTSGTKYYYTAVYTFRITGVSAVTSASVIPVAQIASGTQTKHTDLSTLSSAAVSPSSSTVSLAVTKVVSNTTEVTDGYTSLSYTINLTNTGAAVSVDSVTDKRASGLNFVNGTAKYNGVTIPDPGLVTGTQNSFVFSGPFVVPLGTTGTPTVRSITYTMTVPTCAGAGTFLYQNTATGTIGALIVGSTSSTQARVNAGGTCGVPGLTVNDTFNDALPIEVITSPASSITTTTARINGLVDPNGSSLRNIVFEVGTSPTLAGASSTTVGTTTTATDPYAVYQDLTGLLSGTLFYYRLTVDGVQGEILSFVTPEVAALPTAATTAATDVTTSSATINGSVDPNQVANGAKVKFQYATDSSSGACAGLGTVTTTGFVQSETDTSTEDAVLLGSFPSDVSYALTGLTNNAYYCFKVVAYYNASSASWDTTVAASNWVSFRASVKTAQTITFPNPGSTTTATTVTAGATTTSALAVTYSSNTTDVCIVSGSVITTLIAGTCSLTAEQAGNDSYSAAAPVTVTFAVTKSPQTITFVPTTPVNSGVVVALDGTSTSGLTLSYSAGPSDVCSIVSGSLQTGPSDGDCTVTASQSGNDAYDAATDVVRVVTVNPGPPVITTTSLTDGVIDGAYSQTLAAAGGNGTYGPWEITAGVLPQGLFFDTSTGAITGTPTAAGTVDITFTVVSTGQTSATRTISLTIAKKSQSIDASSVTRAYGSLPVTVGSGASSGLAVSYSVVDTSVAAVVGGMMTPVGVGTTSVTASQAGDDDYLAAPDVTFTVTITAVTITVTASSHSLTYGAGAPTYAASYSGFITGEDESVLTTMPTCTSTYTSASTAGSTPAVTCSGAVASNYVFTYVAGAVTIGKAPQTITVTPNALGEMLPSSTQNFTAASTSGEPVTIVASGACTWVAGVITASASEGTCTMTASVPESTNYYAATDVVRAAEVTAIAKSNRTISLELDEPGWSHDLLEELTGIATVGPTAAVVYSATIGSADVCSIDPSTGVITLLGVGTCTIVVTVAETTDYNPAEATLSFVVRLVSRSLSLVATPTTALMGDVMNLSSAPSAGSGTITYTLLNGALYCAIAGNVITGLGAGDCEVQASITAFGVYASGDSSAVTLTVTAPSPTPTPTPTASSSSSSPVPAPSRSASDTDQATGPIAPSPSPSPSETSARPEVTESSVTTITATGRLPRPTSTTTQIGDTEAPGAPPRGRNSIDTVDLGRGIENADSASPNMDQASRTVAALLGERFGGFAPGSGVIVQVTGSRTSAQFVVSPASELNGLTIAQAIAESRLRLGSEFAAVDGSQLDAHPEGDSVIGGTPTADALLVFADSGLEKPITVGQLEVESAVQWIRVTAHVEGYVPGSVVYLAVTTNPVIVAASLVSKTGTADLTGLVPTDLLEPGGHNLRIVGIRQLSGVTSDADGTIVISDATMTEIRRFDLGTQATVRLVGANSTGGNYQVVRIVQLNPDAPWWTVVLLGLLGLALSAAVALVRTSRRRTAFAASVALGLLTLLPEIAGWLTRAYDVMAWGLIVGLAVQVILWGSRWFTHRERRYSPALGSPKIQTNA